MPESVNEETEPSSPTPGEQKANMNEHAPTEVVPAPVDGKWIEDISYDQPVCEVASRVLAARLKSVCSALPLAATKSDEDVEYVHRLRISTRRAAEALEVFGGVIDEKRLTQFRENLRRIRLAADEARNLDVMAERFARHARAGISLTILEQIKSWRREVQEPIRAVHEQFTADACEETIDQLIQEVAAYRHGEGKRRFGRQSCRYLAPAVKKFFRAAEADLGNDEALHALRIRGKKLRYTMEIVAVAFNAAFRRKLYAQVTRFQDRLGTVHDHAAAKTLFRQWLSKARDPEQKAFMEGVLMAEERATEDLRAAFVDSWTPKLVSQLKRQFGNYC